jgi:hypothetical protein
MACKKETSSPTCFTFGKVGNKWTYEYKMIDDFGRHIVKVDTVSVEITDASNSVFKYNSSWHYDVNFYIGNIFGAVKSFSPLIIDTLVKCDAKVGDS